MGLAGGSGLVEAADDRCVDRAVLSEGTRASAAVRVAEGPGAARDGPRTREGEVARSGRSAQYSVHGEGERAVHECRLRRVDVMETATADRSEDLDQGTFCAGTERSLRGSTSGTRCAEVLGDLNRHWHSRRAGRGAAVDRDGYHRRNDCVKLLPDHPVLLG